MENFHDLIRNQALLSSACVMSSTNSHSNSNGNSNGTRKDSSASSKSTVNGTAATTRGSSEKRHHCSTCGHSFHRAEHLQRHQTRHTGEKPFPCTFCGREFSRKDRLQTHYQTCRWRGDREAPTSIPKGRRPHACITCVSSKIRCDGGNPCGQCKKKRVACRQTPPTMQDESSVDNRLDPIEDRVSIKALLNGGTDTFTETFNLPPCDDRVRSLNFHHQQPEDSEDSAIAVNLTNGGSTISPTTAGVVNDSPESMDYSSMFESLVDLNEQYLDFWTGPFGLIPSPNYSDLQLDVYGVSSSSLMLGGDEVRYGSVSTAAGTNGVRSGPTPSEEVMTTTPTTMATPTQNNHHRPSYPAAEQAEYVSSLSMAIYNKLWCLALDETARQELTACLNFLLTPERISKFISLYFRNWHLNCPMLHKPSFDPSQVPLALVVSVVFNGALYSKDNTERLAARKLFDIAELVVFDAAIFSFETEITRSLEGNSNNKMTNNDDVMPESGSASASIPAPAQASGSASGLTDSFQDPEWQTFQELQAGFLMVVTQYWAGSSIPKHRALESRLGDVIKVVRKFKYHHARHQPSDRISETAWLQKESRIRTIAGIALLDCAGRIYSNFPCRMTLAEFDTDLPCKEAIFSSRHPFMQDDSIFAPRLTISQAFALLFEAKPQPQPTTAASSSSSSKVGGGGETTESKLERSHSHPDHQNPVSWGLTPFDLFILVHFLYVHTHSCIMILSLNLPTTALPPGRRPNNGINPTTASKAGVSPLAANPMFQDLKAALDRWRQWWQAVRSQATDESMKMAGMYRHSFHFWLVLKLIVNKEDAVDVITRMEVNCEDALTKLKVLFQNDGDPD